MRETTNYYAQTARQSTFEENSTQSIKRNTLFRRVEEMRAVEDSKLDARRERLRQLFKEDVKRFTEELLAQEETKESRLEKMRTRMQELKSKREADRKLVVEKKLLQRWRNECDELRTIESKILEEEVARACADQMVERDQKKAQEREEKRFYDALWEQDRLKKIAKEEAEKTRSKEMNAATVAMLESQLDALRKQAAEEERLKQEEAALMRHEIQTLQLQDERALARKLSEQRIIRADLDRFNSLKIAQRAREVADSLSLDMKIVNEFLAMDKAESESKSRRRAELRREMALYREHLREQKAIEEKREREMERMQKEEADKLWRIRTEKWQREQLARDRLMSEVLAGRKEQLKTSIDRNRLRQEEMLFDRAQSIKQIEAAQKIEAVETARKDQAAHAYKEALAAQMEIVEEKKREARKRMTIETNAEKIAELKYRQLLNIETQRTLNNPRKRT